MPAICSAQILPQYTSIVPCIKIDVKVGDFPPAEIYSGPVIRSANPALADISKEQTRSYCV